MYLIEINKYIKKPCIKPPHKKRNKTTFKVKKENKKPKTKELQCCLLLLYFCLP